MIAPIETERLLLRALGPDDAGFVLELVNEPGWLRFIGDRGIRDREAARVYIDEGPVASYERHGHGLLAIVEKTTAIPVGICGLLKRDELEHVDLGFALLAGHAGQGYAEEAARAVLEHARLVLRIERVLAITSPDNERSIRLLKALGMRRGDGITTPGGDELLRFDIQLGVAPPSPPSS